MRTWRLWISFMLIVALVTLTACNMGGGGQGAQQGGGQQQGQGGGQQGGGQLQGQGQASAKAEKPLAFDITGGYNSLIADDSGHHTGETGVHPKGGKGKGTNTIRPLGESALTDAILPFVSAGQSKYIPLADLINLLEYRAEQKGETFEIGENGTEIVVTMNSTQAQVGDSPITLKEAPIRIYGTPHIPVSGVADLFGNDMVFEFSGEKLLIHPSDMDVYLKDTDSLPDTNEALDFSDDPEDPLKDVDFLSGEGEGGAEGAMIDTSEDGAIMAAALTSGDVDKILATAKRYLGVRYKFGADPFPKSNRFDCSSYTQYVFGKHGISLPRTAREQINRGTTVARTNLRKGDLLFFYVPGRFKSNKIPGHVGIYIGNRTMIHALDEPKDGVQYRSIDRPFWKQTFISAKRLSK